MLLTCWFLSATLIICRLSSYVFVVVCRLVAAILCVSQLTVILTTAGPPLPGLLPAAVNVSSAAPQQLYLPRSGEESLSSRLTAGLSDGATVDRGSGTETVGCGRYG